jgi:hypothetical protein
MKDFNVYRLPMAGPDDVSQLAKLIEDGTVDPKKFVRSLLKPKGMVMPAGTVHLALS